MNKGKEKFTGHIEVTDNSTKLFPYDPCIGINGLLSDEEILECFSKSDRKGIFLFEMKLVLHQLYR